MKFGLGTAVAIIAAGAAATTYFVAPSSEIGRGETVERHMQLAQSPYSNRCQTPNGICYVSAQPIGSVCYCGEEEGRIVP